MAEAALSIKGGLCGDGEPVVIWNLGDHVQLLTVAQARWASDQLTRAADAVTATAELVGGRRDVLAAVQANPGGRAS